MSGFSRVQFSHSVESNSLRPHGLQHARLPCPLPTPGVHSNSCPSSQWCHPTISSSVILFSSSLQSSSASASFQMTQFFASGDQSIGVSASASVLWFQPIPMHWWWKYKPAECLTDVSSVQFSHSVVSNSLWPLKLHGRLSCPSPTPGACSNLCPSSWWCHPTISSSVVSFSSCLQSFPASGSFPMSQFIASGGQSVGVSASTSVLPMNIQDWYPLGWTGWISLQSKELSRVFSNTTVQKHQFFGAQLSL